MRVISGSARGRKLSAPEGLDTRPTTDRVKESVFNIISPYLPADNVLDLFAGSGAMGIEALSRGSAHAVFVECGEAAIRTVGSNLTAVRLEERADVHRADAFSFLKRTDESFDIIFLDPPYNTGLLTRALQELADRKCLRSGGIVVAESEYGGEEAECDGFEVIRRAKYGKTVISVLKASLTDGGSI